MNPIKHVAIIMDGNGRWGIKNKKSRIKLTRGRKVRVSGFKKAIITLKKGQNIDLTTGI